MDRNPVVYLNVINEESFKRGGNLICTMCNEKVSLDDSVSRQGTSALCMACVYRLGKLFNKSVGKITIELHKAANENYLIKKDKLSSTYGTFNSNTINIMKEVDKHETNIP